MISANGKNGVESSAPLLILSDVGKTFKGLIALRALSMSVQRGEIRGVIGPNGAGKTTLFNLVSGFFRPSGGSIMFKGVEISRLSADRIAEMGLVRTFQRVAFFHDKTVLENVLAARHLHRKENILAAVLGATGESDRCNLACARDVLQFMGLSSLADEMPFGLSHGHQRALGMAIALATEPELLMLDEPVAGMNPAEAAHLSGLIRRLRDEKGMTIILVEHDMRTVMDLCDNITVVSFGEKLAEGPPEEVQRNREVMEAYLGVDEGFA